MSSGVFAENPLKIITVKGKSERPNTWNELWTDGNDDKIVWDNPVE